MPSDDAVVYGPDIADDSELRLCGDVNGKRVLELGCGDGRNIVRFAQKGAVAIGVESSEERISRAWRRAEDEGVRVELHHGDLADLAFVRADSIDLALSVWALHTVDDLGRVFRQVHRVLRPNAPLVVSIPHPVYDLLDPDSMESLLIRRSYFEPGRHTVSGLFSGLANANFRVDRVLEPEPRAGGARSAEWHDAMRYVPRTLIVRARKEGI
jgi:SAM-dependent methyltransferase